MRSRTCRSGFYKPALTCMVARQAMDAIVEVLVEKETISGDEFRKILGQYAKIPDANYSKWDRETVRLICRLQLLEG